MATTKSAEGTGGNKAGGMKHTPGPWRVDPERTDDGTVFVQGDPSEPIAVCEVFTGSHTFPDCLPAEANARLIAKAPEMRGLLEEIAGRIELVYPGHKDALAIRAMLVEIDGNRAGVHHLTHTGPYAGTPFCTVSKAERLAAGDTFSHVPYSGVDTFMQRPDLCAECRKVWEDAGHE